MTPSLFDSVPKPSFRGFEDEEPEYQTLTYNYNDEQENSNTQYEYYYEYYDADENNNTANIDYQDPVSLFSAAQNGNFGPFATNSNSNEASNGLLSNANLFSENSNNFGDEFVDEFEDLSDVKNCPKLAPFLKKYRITLKSDCTDTKDLGVDGQTCTLECTNENLIPIGINVLNPVRMQLRCIEDVDGNVVWNFRPENRPIKCVMKKFYIKGRCFLGMINTCECI